MQKLLRPDVENKGYHIGEVMQNSSCRKHDADYHEACWNLIPASGGSRHLPAVCGARVKRAGFNGKVSKSAMEQSSMSKLVATSASNFKKHLSKDK